MRAITLPRFGGPEVLTPADIPTPVPGADEILVRVAASGLNRADLSQREGHYPPPAGSPDWPGMEFSGTVVEAGSAVTRWKVGDRVAALVSGGAYAEYAVANEGLVLAIPDGVDLVEAAGIPEVAATVWANVWMSAGLRRGQSLLVHGGSSGIGSMAIQLAVALGNPVFATAGSAAKVEFCTSLGARGINYRLEDFAEVIASETDGGVAVILDIVGADYLERNVASLATEGTLMNISTQSGTRGTLDLGILMRKRARVWSAGLRSRPLAERVAIIADVARNVIPLIEDGRVRTVTDRVFPLEQAADAHRLMASSDHIGKILLAV